MKVQEEVVQFDCQGTLLLGIVSRPPADAGSNLTSDMIGVLIIVGGPQYRAGSHRQFVQLARALAAAGHVALRFDYRGMGDVDGALRNFEHVSDDIAAAIGALQAAEPRVQRVVLWGLCDAASAALMYVQERPDARLVGLALINPWVRSVASLAKAHVKHYYRQRLMDKAFWVKLMKGQVAGAALGGALKSVRAAFDAGSASASASASAKAVSSSSTLPFQARMALGLETFNGPVLLMLSDNDLTAREFVEHSQSDATWRRALANKPPQRVALQGADHTCSQPAAQRASEAATVQWLGQAFQTR
jgi:uncharacterized protein